MKLRMIFEDGHARIVAEAVDDFERRMLGVLSGGEGALIDAFVQCDSRSHASHEKLDRVTVTLRRGERSTFPTTGEVDG